MKTATTSKQAIEKGKHRNSNEGLRVLQWISPGPPAREGDLTGVAVYHQDGEWYVMQTFRVYRVAHNQRFYLEAFAEGRLLWHVIQRYVIGPVLRDAQETYSGTFQLFTTAQPVELLYFDGKRRKPEYIER